MSKHYQNDPVHGTIHDSGLPKEMVSCPSCGRVYGHRRTKVCASCEECSSCCRCDDQQLVTADEMVEHIMEHM